MNGYTYVGRMFRAPGGPFVTPEESAANLALAHQLFGTPKDARHPDILFTEPHDIVEYVFAVFFGVNRLADVWIATSSEGSET